MIFTPTDLPGAMIIDPERRGDDRGYFARVYCKKEFEQHGLFVPVVQTNMSFSKHKGTLRGLHYQVPPQSEDKLVRCSSGAIFDVLVDMRADSATYCRWFGAELSAENLRMLLVPKGFAHGFITLTDDVVVTYQVSEYFSPMAERGLRFDDPAFSIDWPVPVRVISDKDRNWPDFKT